MKRPGVACRLLLAKEIAGLHCSPRARMQNQYRQRAATFECCTSPFARTGKILPRRSENYKSAESNSNSRITKSRTPSISAIPTGTSSRSRLTNWESDPRKCVFKTHQLSSNSLRPSALLVAFRHVRSHRVRVRGGSVRSEYCARVSLAQDSPAPAQRHRRDHASGQCSNLQDIVSVSKGKNAAVAGEVLVTHA